MALLCSVDELAVTVGLSGTVGIAKEGVVVLRKIVVWAEDAVGFVKDSECFGRNSPNRCASPRSRCEPNVYSSV